MTIKVVALTSLLSFIVYHGMAVSSLTTTNCVEHLVVNNPKDVEEIVKKWMEWRQKINQISGYRVETRIDSKVVGDQIFRNNGVWGVTTNYLPNGEEFMQLRNECYIAQLKRQSNEVAWGVSKLEAQPLNEIDALEASANNLFSPYIQFFPLTNDVLDAIISKQGGNEIRETISGENLVIVVDDLTEEVSRMEITLAPALDFMPIQITVLNRELRVGNRFRPAIQVVYQYSDWISVDGSWLWCKAAATNPKETFEIAVAHDVSRYSLDNRECYLSHYGLSEPPFCKSIAKANWYYWLLLPIAICFMFLGYRILCAQTLMRK